MVEEGLVSYITAGLNDSTIPGGYMVQLPGSVKISAATPKAWTWRSIIAPAIYTLNDEAKLTKWELEIICHGFKSVDALRLAHAIRGVLRGGFQGTFSDPDSTYVEGIFQLPNQTDAMLDDNLTFVRILEYQVLYREQ